MLARLIKRLSLCLAHILLLRVCLPELEDSIIGWKDLPGLFKCVVLGAQWTPEELLELVLLTSLKPIVAPLGIRDWPIEAPFCLWLTLLGLLLCIVVIGLNKGP